MEGKAMLIKEFGGINSIPLIIDSQDTEEIIRTIKLLAQ
jgi:malate dehydrogenase (oxaloacetate-decarboxylating)